MTEPAPARRLAVQAFAVVCLVLGPVALAGCAALRAPVVFEPVARDADGRVDRQLHIEAVEGRPNGLVLRFWCTGEASAGMWLEVLRKEGDAPAERIRSVRLDENLSSRLVGDGFEFLDRSVPVETSTAYQVRLRESDDNAPAQLIGASEALTVRWQQPPDRPDDVRASSEIAGVVELDWAATLNTGALIFRRDVLDADARPERLALLGPQARSTFVDRDVEPGGVYAYQVALAVDTGVTIQFGQPSEEIYVTVRPAP